MWLMTLVGKLFFSGRSFILKILIVPPLLKKKRKNRITVV